MAALWETMKAVSWGSVLVDGLAVPMVGKMVVTKALMMVVVLVDP